MEFVYFEGQRIAWRNSSGAVYYVFSDHLGSLRTMTNATGVIQKESDFYPYGLERVVSNTVDLTYKFAGMEFDSETADYHTLYRQYSPNLGRWVSPDPVKGTTDNPQTWNLYPYVTDNPTNLTDPLGLCVNDAIGSCGDFFFATTHAECRDIPRLGDPIGAALGFQIGPAFGFCDTNPKWAKTCQGNPTVQECELCCTTQATALIAIDCAIGEAIAPIIGGILCKKCLQDQERICKEGCKAKLPKPKPPKPKPPKPPAPKPRS